MQKNGHQRHHICFSLPSEPELTHTIHLICQCPPVSENQSIARVTLLQPFCISLPGFIEMHPVIYVTLIKVNLEDDKHTSSYNMILFHFVNEHFIWKLGLI